MAGTGRQAPDVGADPVAVLLVDDDADIRLVLRELLARRHGWRVVGEAADGSQAVPMLERLQPHIVVLDLTMPTPGDEVLPHLLKVAPRCMVAVCSAADASEQRARLLDLGAFSYYEKSRLAELPDLLAADFDRFRLALSGEDTVPGWLGDGWRPSSRRGSEPPVRP